MRNAECGTRAIPILRRCTGFEKVCNGVSRCSGCAAATHHSRAQVARRNDGPGAQPGRKSEKAKKDPSQTPERKTEKAKESKEGRSTEKKVTGAPGELLDFCDFLVRVDPWGFRMASNPEINYHQKRCRRLKAQKILLKKRTTANGTHQIDASVLSARAGRGEPAP